MKKNLRFTMGSKKVKEEKGGEKKQISQCSTTISA